MLSYFVGIGQSGIAAAGSTRYTSLDGALVSGNATESVAQQVMPDARDLDSFYVKIATAPGASKNLVFTVRKNGADTAITCTITGSGTTGSYTGAAVSFAAGDKVSVSVTLTSSGTTPGSLAWTCRQSGTGQAILFNTSGAGITATTVMAPHGGGTASVFPPCPTAGTITALYAMSDVNPTPGNWQVTVRVATVDTAATVNIPSGQAAGTTVNITGLSVSVPVGDSITIRAVAAASPGSSRIAGGLVFVPTDGSTAIMLGTAGTASQNSQANYLLACGSRAGAVATSEALGLPQAYMQACTIKALYGKTLTVPGAGKSYDITARLNNATDTAATINIAGSSLSTANITGLSVAVALGDLLDVKDVPNTTPNAEQIATGIAYTLAGTVTVPPDAVAGVATVSVTRVARTRTLWNTVG